MRLGDSSGDFPTKAVQGPMTSAATLYAEVIRYGLDIPQDMRDASPEERGA